MTISSALRRALLIGAGLVLATGCSASPTPHVRSGAPPSTAEFSSPAGSASTTGFSSSVSEEAGYSCSAADITGQPPGSDVRETAAYGSVSAVLSGTSNDSYGLPNGVTDAKLTITSGGGKTTAVVAPAIGASSGVQLDTIGLDNGKRRSSLCVVRFSDGENPIVLVALTTGGAHCCSEVRAYEVDAASDEARAADHEFGNYAPALVRDGGTADLVSVDNTFAYAFSSYANSAPPVIIFTYVDGAFANVTSQHRESIEADLATHWREYTDPTNHEPLGALAGWAADKCLLDPTHAGEMWAFLDQQAAAEKLSAPANWPSGEEFVAALRSLLEQQHYCAPASNGTPTPAVSPSG